jgi:hypothetical protein
MGETTLKVFSTNLAFSAKLRLWIRVHVISFMHFFNREWDPQTKIKKLFFSDFALRILNFSVTELKIPSWNQIVSFSK